MKTNMKTKLMVVVAAATAMFTGALRADLTRYTEKVDGWTWEYEIAEGKAQEVIGWFTSKYTKPGPNLVIPAKLGGKAVASLGINALQGYDFTTVTIPSTVTYIGYRAFGYCRYLKSVKLPDSVKTVAYHAFEGCTGLQCVDFGKNVSFIGEMAFSDCSSLRSLVFRGAKEPGTVDNNAFAGVAEGCTVYVPAKAKGWPTDSQWQGLPRVIGDCMVNVNVDVYEGGGVHGTVSGGGVFAVGKKITLKATPNKGCLCAGWADDVTEVYYGHSESLSYVVTGADTDFRTGFVQSNATEDYLYVDALYAQYDADDDGTVYVPVDVRSLSEPKITVKGLPSGVKFDAAKLVLTGRATKPGVYLISVSATNKSIKEPKTAEFNLNVPDFKDELIPVEGFYGAYTPGVIDVTTIDAAAGCKVTGLPPGMKWTDKDIYKKGSKTEVEVPANSVYGAPTKPGFYTVFFTKTDDKKVKHTATATFSVAPFKKLEVEMVGNSGKDKVTGAGEYAVGKKITLKATADKGKVFCGWYVNSECTSLIDHSATFPIEMPNGDVKFYAKFVEAAEDANPANVQTVLYGTGYPIVLSKEVVPVATIHCGVYVEWPIAAAALSATTVKVSGLPAGLKFTAKEILDSNKDPIVPANSIYGVPTKAGSYNLKITVTTAGKNSFDYAIYGDVNPLDRWAVGLFEGFGGPKSFPGPVSLTVAENGKISGKFSCSDGSVWSLSAPYFYAQDDDDGEYHATVTCKNGKSEWQEELAIAVPKEPIGEVAATMTGDLGDMELYQTFWKDEVWKDVGKVVDKAVFEYDEGDSSGSTTSVTLTFKSDGSVKTKGVFKDSSGSYTGTGSSTLVPLAMPNESGSFPAFVNVYFLPNKKNFGGYFETVYLWWTGTEKEFFPLDL